MRDPGDNVVNPIQADIFSMDGDVGAHLRAWSLGKLSGDELIAKLAIENERARQRAFDMIADMERDAG